MAILDDVAQFITDNVSEVTAGSYSILKSYKSNSPDKQVVIYETGGSAPETTFDADYPTFQIQVRGEKFGYEATHAVAFAIYRALHIAVVLDQDVSPPSTYVYCYAMGSGVLPLGHDEKDRPEFTMNFRIMRTF